MKKLLFIMLLFPSFMMAQGLKMENIANSIHFKEESSIKMIGWGKSYTMMTSNEKSFGDHLLDVTTYVVIPFAAGMGNGVHEAIIWRYDQFAEKYPNHNPQQWNALISWRNKHMNGDPNQGPAFFGSRSFMVWDTDWYHRSGAIRTTGLFTFTGLMALDLINNSPTFKQTLFKFGVAVASYVVGNHLAYNEIMQ